MTSTLDTFDTQALRNTFCNWQKDKESLDAQLAESLAALEAYQSHLDGWQQQLARQRDELRSAKEQLDHDRAELNRALAEHKGTNADNTSAAELEHSRKQIVELTEQLRARIEELQQLKQSRPEVVEKPAPEPTPETPSQPRTASPVLGSIVEQFGKLRQQRAVDRRIAKSPR